MHNSIFDIDYRCTPTVNVSRREDVAMRCHTRYIADVTGDHQTKTGSHGCSCQMRKIICIDTSKYPHKIGTSMICKRTYRYMSSTRIDEHAHSTL